MIDVAILLDWSEAALRWLHVITAIAWIGSSFYFIALDLGLRPTAKPADGVRGEEWQVHGGGFYHIRKYLVAPASLPEHLTWFKWESYATWLSGFALLAVVYYLGADLYLIDHRRFDLAPLYAIGISMASLILGWIFYNTLCKVFVEKSHTLLMVFLFAILVCMAWGYTQVFSGRAALLHLGAFTATVMSANVFFIIIPNQKIVVADMLAGRTPDPRYGVIAKQRSLHNNYLVLPVIFLMLSNHYPLAFASDYNWLIASLVFLMGVTIRHYFNCKHARLGKPTWTWAATALLFIAIIFLSLQGKDWEAIAEEESLADLPASQQIFGQDPHFATVASIVQSRCSMCHAAEPAWDGLATAPKGIMLETEAQIAAQARTIYLQSAATDAMPPSNLSFMEAQERLVIQQWYRAVTEGAAAP